MALGARTQNVPLLTLDQKSPATSGPLGRLLRLVNGVVEKYDRPEAGGAIRVQKRFGFTSLTTTVKDPDSGAASAQTTEAPSILTGFGSQLFEVAGDNALVLAESSNTWQSLDYTQLTNILTQRPVSAANGIAYVPDGAATAAGTTMTCWGEGGGGVKAMVFDASGTPLRTAFFLDATAKRGKIVVDSSDRYWTFTDTDATHIVVQVFTAVGVLLGTTTVALSAGFYFDVSRAQTAATVLLVQKDTVGGGVKLSTFTWNGSTIVTASANNTNALCQKGIVQFIINTTGDGWNYIATVDGAAPGAFTVYVTAMSDAAVTHHRYTVQGAVGAICNISGYVHANATITVAIGILSDGYSPADPGDQIRNFTFVDTVTFAGAQVFNRLNTMTPYSRVFQLGTKWVGAFYYGSGPNETTLAAAGVDVTIPLQQPTFFLVDMDTRQIAGRFEFATAYGSWVTDNNYLACCCSVYLDTAAQHRIPVAYRAETFITQGVINVAPFKPIPAKDAFTVAVKEFLLGARGQPSQIGHQLLLPGPLTSTFGGSLISENGINLAPQIISIATSATPGGLSGPEYSYVVVYEVFDENGDLVQSIASPPVSHTRGGASALDIIGVSLAATNRSRVLISIYRNAKDPTTGIMSTVHYKVTSDLSPLVNGTGSSTWTYTDIVSDLLLQGRATAYSDANIFDHFPAPSSSTGVSWKSRQWMVGDDNAVWMSAEKTEGLALYWNPAWRILVPTNERVTAVGAFDNWMPIFSERQMFYIDAAAPSLPDPTGVGTLPTPLPLAFPNGCTGFTATTSDGVFYSSSAGGVWLLTPDRQNIYISAPVEDLLKGRTVNGMAIDQDQRLLVTLEGVDGFAAVWDSVAKQWYEWQLPTAVDLCTSFRGRFQLGAPASLWKQVADQYEDIFLQLAETDAILTTIELSPLYFSSVRGFKLVWNVQFQGVYYGDHDLHVTVVYANGDQELTDTFDFTPNPTSPYVYELPPTVEECSSMSFTFEDAFPRGPSRGFALELLAFEFGVESGLGRLPTSKQPTPT